MNMTADSTEFAGTAVASDDLDLVHAIQSGDVSAFDQLVGRYDHLGVEPSLSLQD